MKHSHTSTELTMLGTGNAAVTRCYNTCFALRHGSQVLLVDAGGGNGILPRLAAAGIRLPEITELFLTHTHTDHILGAVWVLRMLAQGINSGQFTAHLRLLSHPAGLEALDTICRLTLPPKVCARIGNDIEYVPLSDGAAFTAAGMQGSAFDIGSSKAKQFGFRLALPDGKSLVCLGDEPFSERNRAMVEHADWLLCEAFCCYADKERFKPYEKHHSTALDAGRLAARLDVKNLLLYHTEDSDLPNRSRRYTAEAATCFSGRIEVPEDGQTITL